MHFVVSWDISTKSDDREKIEERLLEVLKPYSWVRPLTTFYIVKVDSQSTWDRILTGLTKVGKESSGRVDLIMSPLMSGGRYNGLLDADTWKSVNERSA